MDDNGVKFNPGDLKILAVEDSPTQALVLQGALVRRGYDVRVAKRCNEAISLMREFRPKIVLSDIVLPDMTGYELCKLIKSDPANSGVYVILVTTLTDPGDVLRSLECGADSFLAKPYDAGLIASCINSIVANAELCAGLEGGAGAGGMDVYFTGKRRTIALDRAHVLNFLLSTYEIAVHNNLKLIKMQDALKKTADIAEERRREIEAINVNLEEKVAEQAKKAREKDAIMMHQSRLAAMGEMVGNIAHQWRQPLNALGIVITNIEDAYAHNEMDAAALASSSAKARQLLKKMSTTIDDFRNFFRPNKSRERFSLNRAVGEAVSLVEASFKCHDVSIAVEEGAEVFASGFPGEYTQVVLNLLGNARDAIIGKGVKNGVISIAVRKDGGKGIVSVADNGGGIPGDIIGRIFDVYFTTKDEGKGTGIGLYMSKVIIEEHMNGGIEARNAGAGAEFRITTPAD